MALIRSSTLSNISGSIGGTTYARNRGGAYARNRTVPINPNSSFQTRARSSLATMSGGWSSVLTSGQRSAWVAYAETQSVLNRLGESITLSGQQAYVRSNTLLELAGQPLVTAPPTITPPTLAVAGGFVASYDVSDAEVSVDLLNVVTGFFLCFCGPAQSAGARSVKVPFRFFGVSAQVAQGTLATAESSGARTFSAGDRMAWRFVLVTQTGAVSNELIIRGEAVA